MNPESDALSVAVGLAAPGSYSVSRVSGHPNYMVGTDESARACLLIEASHPSSSFPSIVLSELRADFGLLCRVEDANGGVTQTALTVVVCRSADQGVSDYFLSLCGALVTAVGDAPTQERIAEAIGGLAAVLQALGMEPTTTVLGLWGELFLIDQADDARLAVESWHIDPSSAFDFSRRLARLEAKTTSRQNRVHDFSYLQCAPQANCRTLVASIMTEPMDGGLSIRQLLDRVSSRIDSDANLKLRHQVARTLGRTLIPGLDIGYDDSRASSSLRYFWLSEVPAVRAQLPAGVSNVRFSSDLSLANPVDALTVGSECPDFCGLLGEV